MQWIVVTLHSRFDGFPGTCLCLCVCLFRLKLHRRNCCFCWIVQRTTFLTLVKTLTSFIQNPTIHFQCQKLQNTRLATVISYQQQQQKSIVNLNQCTTENCNHFDHLWITIASIACWLAIHGYRTCQIPTELNEAKQKFCICRNYIYFQRGGPELSESQFLWIFGKRSSLSRRPNSFDLLDFFGKCPPSDFRPRPLAKSEVSKPMSSTLRAIPSPDFYLVWPGTPRNENSYNFKSGQKILISTFGVDHPNLITSKWKTSTMFWKVCVCMTHSIVRWSNEHLAKASVFSGIKFKT